RFLELYEPRIARLSRPYPGVRDTLARLAGAGFRLGVCTNKASRATRRLLDDLALSRYFAAVAGGDGPARKPDPKHLLAVLDALGAAPETALMVGDSANDVHAARAAGVRVAVVSFGYTTVPAAELGADALIDRFEQLAALVGL
ncbi:MAG TPA: HAD-IA family hydrolase, partial [Alphaproteobacteria bacterium]|nr:HAD-IA family hydrolase [Alphaproteobacteria bacterium]